MKYHFFFTFHLTDCKIYSWRFFIKTELYDETDGLLFNQKKTPSSLNKWISRQKKKVGKKVGRPIFDQFFERATIKNKKKVCEKKKKLSKSRQKKKCRLIHLCTDEVYQKIFPRIIFGQSFKKPENYIFLACPLELKLTNLPEKYFPTNLSI